MSSVVFNRNGAMQYVEEHNYQLPKKAESDNQLLIEVIEESILSDIKKVSVNERFDCGSCGKIVQEKDTYCWFCGADVSDVVESVISEQKSQLDSEDKKNAKSMQSINETNNKVNTNSERALSGFITKILAENGKSGHSAWLIGRALTEIQTSSSFLEKYETFEECVNKELAFSWRMTTEYMRIFKNFQEEEAKLPGLGLVKLLIIAGSPESARTKLLEAAKPKGIGGNGLTREELKQAVRDACDKAGRKRTGKESREKLPAWVNFLKKDPLRISMQDGAGSRDVGAGYEIKAIATKTEIKIWAVKIEEQKE